ncbi:MAG: hypothetical protein A4S09_06265 [Proteobacteria bacterium SG_bin7]|nr:MAG: hypothetical protein A4S09_06265 [Proteobacteria bacterium SG_bin7]
MKSEYDRLKALYRQHYLMNRGGHVIEGREFFSLMYALIAEGILYREGVESNEHTHFILRQSISQNFSYGFFKQTIKAIRKSAA